MKLTQEWVRNACLEMNLTNQRYDYVHPDQIRQRLENLEKKGACLEKIGKSRNGKPIFGVALGDENNPVIALTGNCHAEEIVGTLTIISLFESLLENTVLSELLGNYRFVAIPQMNPDGVIQNWDWISDPTPKSYLRYVWRDHRGEDVEHGIAEGNREFERPEPQALVKFYSQHAAGKCRFYCTLHSCQWAPGAYFLTGNEAEGVMAPAFNLIRQLAPEIGMTLMTDNRRGFKHFRRISDGVYNVPRHKEMAAGQKAAGMTGQGFLVSSLEWMERHGADISLVSEVPMIKPKAFTEEVIEGVPAIALVAPIVPILEQYATEMEKLLTELKGSSRKYVKNEKRLRWYSEEFHGWGKNKAQYLASFFHCFAGRTALKMHEARLLSQPAYRSFKLAAAAVNTLKESAPRYDEFSTRLDEAYKKMEEVLGLEGGMTSLEIHIRLQLLLILSGIMVAPRS